MSREYQTIIDKVVEDKAIVRQKLESLRLETLTVVDKAAIMLKKDFGVKDVFVFGSLIAPERFHSNSDVDLAISGLAPESYFTACAKVSDLFKDFEVDLVDLNDCNENLKNEILTNGIKL